MTDPTTALAAALKVWWYAERPLIGPGGDNLDDVLANDARIILAALSGYTLVKDEESLDAAWKAAEAALTDGRITSLSWPSDRDDEWKAVAFEPNGHPNTAFGSTPAEALRNLAAALTTPESSNAK